MSNSVCCCREICFYSLSMQGFFLVLDLALALNLAGTAVTGSEQPLLDKVEEHFLGNRKHTSFAFLLDYSGLWTVLDSCILLLVGLG